MDIIWQKPSLSGEIDEYFDNPDTKDFFDHWGYEFKVEADFLDFFQPLFDEGSLVTVDYHLTEAVFKGPICTKEPVQIGELQERISDDEEYAGNYIAMQSALEKDGTLRLPAPIYFYFDREGFGYLFSGDRRKLLSYTKNIPLQVWWVNVIKTLSSIVNRPS